MLYWAFGWWEEGRRDWFELDCDCLWALLLPVVSPCGGYREAAVPRHSQGALFTPGSKHSTKTAKALPSG